jgi:hypothetical protein
MPNIKCFFIEPTSQLSVRLIIDGPRTEKCPLSKGWEGQHSAESEPFRVTLDMGPGEHDWALLDSLVPETDPRYPKQCECGYVFSEDAYRGRVTSRVHRNAETGEEYDAPDSAPVGAMWDAYWMPESPEFRGPDGRSLTVKTPGGDWNIDSRASNCTMPDDKVHKCWVRHGEVPNITVDKAGETCGAGAGSILCGSYHGFLINGELVQC